MAKRAFTVRAVWDDEAKIYYSESDIIGLHIEAPTVDEFEAVMREVAPELIVANHVSMPDLATTPLLSEQRQGIAREMGRFRGQGSDRSE
ncbi:MAG TPA: DUF1902 domain-containing protein [Devosiaceae bacterium]|nr:DUF1902 domain-containing protein [Devosiaceae bacterium]